MATAPQVRQIDLVEQNAADGRGAFAFGGSGSNRIHSRVYWEAGELTLDNYKHIFKANKACFVSNFSIRSDDMDSHATPTLEWNVGSTTTGAEFYAGSGTTIGEAGGSDVTNAVDESTEAGTALAADAIIYLSVETAAATGAAGWVTVSFDIAPLSE